jgi:hypothetical protein
MIYLYILNTIFVVLIVLAVWFPREARTVLQRLGLWEWVRGIDGKAFRLWVRRLGILLILMAVALFASILTGSHPWDWALPAGEALFFGGMLYWVGHWSKDAP